MSKQPPGSYPRQPTQQYPTQMGYLQQLQQQQQHIAQQQYYNTSAAPPMYSHQGASHPQQGYLPGSQPMGIAHQSPYGVPPPPYSAVPQPVYSQEGVHPSYPIQTQMMPMLSAQQPHMVVSPMQHGMYDPGARFSAGATANIPPAPPGCVPTSAQVATAQGQPVVMTQRPENWMSGGSSGGYTIW